MQSCCGDRIDVGAQRRMSPSAKCLSPRIKRLQYASHSIHRPMTHTDAKPVCNGLPDPHTWGVALRYRF